MKNIRNIVLEAISTDDSFTEKQNYKLVMIYLNASRNEKEIIDSVFICLCGYSLESIVRECQLEPCLNSENTNQMSGESSKLNF